MGVPDVSPLKVNTESYRSLETWVHVISLDLEFGGCYAPEGNQYRV